MKSKKSFDCVEMKRRAQEKIFKETSGMSVDEQLAYWKKHEQAFRREIVQSTRTPRRSKAAHAKG
ncbi:MAG: hypothetical protein HY098_05585 [Nitrospinae bacterium]|nr:hypothetical protein [Nitrospinota bacterium]